MRIGIDVDGVLTDVEKFQLNYGSKYCFENNLGKIVNPKAYKIYDVFGKNKEFNLEFWSKHLEIYATKEKIRPFASEVIKKLKEEGNEIYIVTARLFTEENTELGDKSRKMLESWLENNEVIYDKLIYTGGYHSGNSGENKLQICIDSKIDLMIEDCVENINNLSNNIPVICYEAAWNQECVGKNIYRCWSWYDVYSKVQHVEETI